MSSRVIDEVGDRVAGEPGFAQNVLLLGLQALASRSLVWVAALGGGAIWGYTATAPDVMHIIAAVGYCGTIFVPILIRDSKGD